MRESESDKRVALARKSVSDDIEKKYPLIAAILTGSAAKGTADRFSGNHYHLPFVVPVHEGYTLLFGSMASGVQNSDSQAEADHFRLHHGCD